MFNIVITGASRGIGFATAQSDSDWLKAVKADFGMDLKLAQAGCRG
jgi:hypothetical protein